MKTKDPEAWKQVLELNQGRYEASALRFAEWWADLMEARIAAGARLEDIAKETSEQASREVCLLSGLQFAAAVAALVKHWEHGGALRLWYTQGRLVGGAGRET